jgi:hypothetical protein
MPILLPEELRYCRAIQLISAFGHSRRAGVLPLVERFPVARNPTGLRRIGELMRYQTLASGHYSFRCWNYPPGNADNPSLEAAGDLGLVDTPAPQLVRCLNLSGLALYRLRCAGPSVLTMLTTALASSP